MTVKKWKKENELQRRNKRILQSTVVEWDEQKWGRKNAAHNHPKIIRVVKQNAKPNKQRIPKRVRRGLCHQKFLLFPFGLALRLKLSLLIRGALCCLCCFMHLRGIDRTLFRPASVSLTLSLLSEKLSRNSLFLFAVLNTLAQFSHVSNTKSFSGWKRGDKLISVTD